MTEISGPNNEGSLIQVTHRDDYSYMMSLAQFLARQFRKRIFSGLPKHADGSVELEPPQASLGACTVSQRTVCDVHIYDFVLPQQPSQKPRKRIYYFAGGSWQSIPGSQHWHVCSKIATDIPDAFVSLVSMPLAPNNPAPDSFPKCLKLYRALMADAKEAGESVILAGDSSGGNVVLCLVLEALREDAESAESRQIDQEQTPLHPVAIMSVCPSVDLTRKNPDIEKLREYDPLLTPEWIKQSARTWHADWDAMDARVSPINANVSLLAKRGIKVHGITAGYDLLCPDGILFRDRCAKEGVKGEWLHWEGQMHCFILFSAYGLREGRQGLEWMIDVLKKE